MRANHLGGHTQRMNRKASICKVRDGDHRRKVTNNSTVGITGKVGAIGAVTNGPILLLARKVAARSTDRLLLLDD